MQQAGMAAQTCLAKKDVMTGVAIMFFFQGLGGAIFVSISQTIFTSSLIKYLGGFQGITPQMIVHTGATELRNLVPAQYLDLVLVAYNRALSDVFKVGLACACATIVAGFTMEWKSIKGLKQGGPQPPVDTESGVLEKREGCQEDGTVTDTETVVGGDSPPMTAVEARDK
jgi:hypothetical protein